MTYFMFYAIGWFGCFWVFIIGGEKQPTMEKILKACVVLLVYVMARGLV